MLMLRRFFQDYNCSKAKPSKWMRYVHEAYPINDALAPLQRTATQRSYTK